MFMFPEPNLGGIFFLQIQRVPAHGVKFQASLSKEQSWVWV